LIERPPRLHLVALCTIWACGELSANEKIVYYHLWSLDNGPEGAWIATDSLAQRLHLSPKTIEDIRARLVQLGLLMSLPRPGARQRGWVCLMPAEFVPRARVLRDAYREAPGLAFLFDRHLVARLAWAAGRAGQAPDEGRAIDPSADESSTRYRTGSAPRPGRGSTSTAAALGGVGGAPPTSEATYESTLSPAVTAPEQQEGVGAVAPETEEGEAGGRHHELRDPKVVRAEGLALIRLTQGKQLTHDEQALVREWLKRQPPDRQARHRKAVGE
jgi:hypothetical protein